MANEVARFTKKVHDIRAHEAKLFNDANALHQQLATAEDPPGPETQHMYDQLKAKYRDVYTNSIDEFKYASESLRHLKKVLARVESKQKKRKADELGSSSSSSSAAQPPRPKQPRGDKSVGDVWSHEGITLAENQQVAALIDPHSKPPLWIQASIKGIRRDHNRIRYEIVDEDPGDAENPPLRKRYILDLNKVICMPTLEQAPMNKRREFQKGDRVLAIYPVNDTTVLYPGSVLKKKKGQAVYSIQFDDDDEDNRDVEAQWVVPLPDDYYTASND